MGTFAWGKIMKYCCDNMEYYAEQDIEIEYSKRLNYYSMTLRDDEYSTSCQLYYCPWCGIKLPQSLDGVWSKTLKAEYGLDDPIFDDADKVPEEFKSDEWWRKRGL